MLSDVLPVPSAAELAAADFELVTPPGFARGPISFRGTFQTGEVLSVGQPVKLKLGRRAIPLEIMAVERRVDRGGESLHVQLRRRERPPRARRRKRARV